jgi:U3 small nucleolar RNA-associated protein 18
MSTALKDRRKHDDDSDKDSTEEELERLIFGDSAGFRENIRSFADTGALAKVTDLVLADDQDNEEDATGLEGLADQDLFFLDDRPGDAPILPVFVDGDDESIDGRGDVAAWTDSDDERITISLASRTQLRKLRRTEADDIVTGKEYSRRLRKQFQLLSPVPAWVSTANGSAGRARKKRRTSSGSEVTDSSEDEMDVDDDKESNLIAQPLAQLLRDVDSLTRTTQKNGTSKNRKLRPEVIDIQRMKDIVSSGPVSTSSVLYVFHKLTS